MTSTATIAALLSTGFISLAPNLILFIFPNFAAGEGNLSRSLSLGQAIAAGGLLGDVFLHTLPDAKAHEEAGLWVLMGFTIFFAADLVIRTLDRRQGHSHNKKGEPDEQLIHANSMILLNLAADCLHNFTDGLAIGASYAAQKHTSHSLRSLLRSRGGLASLSILFHEVPHELGDFCTLIRAGYSKNQAIAAQFITAIAAFLGTIGALSVAEGWAGDALIFVTAGGFVYLAATTILPEVLGEGQSAWFRVSQLLSFGIGIGFLYVVSLLEVHDDHGHSHSHHNSPEHYHHEHYHHEHYHHEHDHVQHIDHHVEL